MCTFVESWIIEDLARLTCLCLVSWCRDLEEKLDVSVGVRGAELAGLQYRRKSVVRHHPHT